MLNSYEMCHIETNGTEEEDEQFHHFFIISQLSIIVSVSMLVRVSSWRHSLESFLEGSGLLSAERNIVSPIHMYRITMTV